MAPLFNIPKLFPVLSDPRYYLPTNGRKKHTQKIHVPHKVPCWAFMAAYSNQIRLLSYALEELHCQPHAFVIFMVIMKGDVNSFLKIHDAIPYGVHSCNRPHLFNFAALYGKMDILECLVQLYPESLREMTIYYAIIGGKMDCYKYLRSKMKCKMDMQVYYAAIANRPEFFVYTTEKEQQLSSKHLAKNGKAKALAIMKKHNLSFAVDLMEDAAYSGNIECVKFVHEFSPYVSPSSLCISLAAQSGSLECVKFLHSVGYSIYPSACTAAAGRGHLECLKYLHENDGAWDIDTITLATSKGHLECVKYAVEHGCPIRWSSTSNKEVWEYIVGTGNPCRYIPDTQ